MTIVAVGLGVRVSSSDDELAYSCSSHFWDYCSVIYHRKRAVLKSIGYLL